MPRGLVDSPKTRDTRAKIEREGIFAWPTVIARIFPGIVMFFFFFNQVFSEYRVWRERKFLPTFEEQDLREEKSV